MPSWNEVEARLAGAGPGVALLLLGAMRAARARGAEFLISRDRSVEAVPQFREAVRLRPDDDGLRARLDQAMALNPSAPRVP